MLVSNLFENNPQENGMAVLKQLATAVRDHTDIDLEVGNELLPIKYYQANHLVSRWKALASSRQQNQALASFGDINWINDVLDAVDARMAAGAKVGSVEGGREVDEGWKSNLAGAALIGMGAMGSNAANARDLSYYNTDYLQAAAQGGKSMVSADDAKAELQQRAQGKQQAVSAPDPGTKASAGYSKEYLQSVIDGTHPRPMISKDRAQALLQQYQTNEASYIDGKTEDPGTLRWKQTSMSYEAAVNKYGADHVRKEGKNRAGQEVIAVHVPLGEQAVSEGNNDEYNDESGMAYNSLRTIHRATKGLANTIKDGDNLPEWCQEKISLAEDYLVTVWDYLQSEKGMAEGLTQTLRRFDPTINARIRSKSQDQTNQGIDTIDHLAGMGLTSDDMVSRAMKPDTYFRNAARYAKLAKEGVAEGLGYSQDPAQAKWYHEGRKAYKFGTTGNLIQDIAKKHGVPSEWIEAFHAGYQDQEGFSKDGVSEGNIWHGTDSGSDEADNTDHNFEEATQYIKGAYPFHKTYNVYRAEPGFRALFNPGHFLKGIAHTEKVDSGLDQLQLKRNHMMSGGAQVSASIGYSWSVLENASTGIALLYYQDRGMGSDQIIIAAKDKQQLAGALGVFRDAGVIPDPSEMAARKAEKAAGRTAILQKKGLVVGVKFSERPGDGSNMYKITDIAPSGKVKAVNLDTGQVRIWSPGSISKGMLQTGLYPDEFDEPRQGVAEDEMSDFIAGGGEITQVPFRKPRKAERLGGSKHIGGPGDPSTSRFKGISANTQGKAVIGQTNRVSEAPGDKGSSREHLAMLQAEKKEHEQAQRAKQEKMDRNLEKYQAGRVRASDIKVAEASKTRTPTRDFLRKHPVPDSEMVKPVKNQDANASFKNMMGGSSNELTKNLKIKEQGMAEGSDQETMNRHIAYYNKLGQTPEINMSKDERYKHSAAGTDYAEFLRKNNVAIPAVEVMSTWGAGFLNAFKYGWKAPSREIDQAAILIKQSKQGMAEARTVDDLKDELTSWKKEGPWKKSTTKDPRGKAPNLSDRARRETEKSFPTTKKV